jgi:valyl-tRNA synthetase
MDTWATSSLTPQIVAGWLDDPDLYNRIYPFTLRPQAHEIIRTWAFYTIAKSMFHFNSTPWRDVFISGWGIAGQGEGKISKSRGGGPMLPVEMMEKYSADAVRYWAASTGPGKDAIISEEKIQTGAKLVNKIWNVARFSQQFIRGDNSSHPIDLSPADRWILSGTQELVQRVTNLFQNYDYAAAKAEIETFFWMFADNYLEMAKQRLYDPESSIHDGAKFTLYHVLLTLLKLFAPILPFITDAIYQEIFKDSNTHQSGSMVGSIHKSQRPEPVKDWVDREARTVGEYMVEIATQIRRYKSERNLSLGTELSRVKLSIGPGLGSKLKAAIPDLKSITRVRDFDIIEEDIPPFSATHGKRDLLVEILT